MVKPIEIFEYYDRSLIFVTEEGGQKLLSLHQDETIAYDELLQVVITEAHLDKVRTGAIDIRQAFRDAETKAYLIRMYNQGESVITPLNEIPDDMLPDEGVTVYVPNKQE